jgi:hypothetical protein
MKRRARTLIFVALGLLLPLTAARAQWARQPDGEWGYSHSLTTSGLFVCLNPGNFLPGGSCTASGNSLMLTNGTSTMTVTFTGSIQTVLATGTRTGPIVMGTLTKSVTGGPFALPPMANTNAPLFRFDLLLSSTIPFPTSGNISFGYTGRTGSSLPYDCCDFLTYAVINVLLPPEPLRYGPVIYDTFAGLDIGFNATPQTITSRVGIIPEPATVVLLATGLLVLGVMRRPGRQVRP